ncbi:hypothetical protein EDD56_109206 [Pseudobacteriovorax antillogorgiicola]|nr:hypothetical protein EDD56_109206 [Pseudobacteriovorax antillogorgiicola]
MDGRLTNFYLEVTCLSENIPANLDPARNVMFQAMKTITCLKFYQLAIHERR